MLMTNDLAELRRVDVADIYKGGRLAGHLARNDQDSVTFTYLAEYLGDQRLPAVAFTLPKRANPITSTGGSVPAFFAGLLPEGARLSALTRAASASADDMLTLLMAVGSDTVGDVQIVPVGTDLATITASPMAGSAATFSELYALSVGMTPDVVALPGVQEKVSAEMMSAPVIDGPRPAILKLDPPGYPHLVANEYFFMSLARAVGIRIPDLDLRTDSSGDQGLFVARFDRQTRPGEATIRLAQEDACQLLGRYPAAKYSFTGQQVLAALGNAVARSGGSGQLAIQQALEIAAFSYLIGNGDLHAKNLSMRVRSDGVAELTPAYDLLCTQPYLKWRDRQALAFFGRDAKYSAQHLVDAADRLGSGKRAMHATLTRFADVVPTWIGRVGEIGFDDRDSERLARLLEHRLSELAPVQRPGTGRRISRSAGQS